MWLIVLNRRSGRGHASRYCKQLTAQLVSNKITFKVIDDDSADQTQLQLQQHLKNPEVENVIAIGGDGLVHLCIQNLANSDRGFAVVPAGTGNDFARCTGIHRLDVAKIFDLIINTTPKAIDLGCIKSLEKTEWFVQVLSTGFDSNVNQLANRIGLVRGRIKYTIAMLLVIAKFKPINYSLEIDGKILDVQSMLLSVANGGNYGGGMKICPTADNTDCKLNLISIDPVSRFTLLRIVPKVFRGTHVNHPKVKSYSGRRVKLSGATFAYADGEFISRLPVEISVSGGALKTWINL
jgi:diacylglycerol kinase (ATP)